ncbi:MAG TPA: zinc ribbon domain-containing protein [Aggregatilinea sp.]|uniref:FmdB family zinc ribbon protein n=1 Tax=Aggregatilinea TaxID=2806306 RepID=UPI000E5A53AD|nr:MULTISPECIES: zinc ribbon domain-containing protein [Aggregatilinea]HML22393.1 zinc ribbon domain-containing protein [Aggregatilinea sp.]
MATYSYRCRDCQTLFQVQKPMAEIDAETLCPACGAAETQRLISAVAVFSSSADGQRRALAGAPSCGSCGMAATGCTSCGPH